MKRLSFSIRRVGDFLLTHHMGTVQSQRDPQEDIVYFYLEVCS